MIPLLLLRLPVIDCQMKATTNQHLYLYLWLGLGSLRSVVQSLRASDPVFIAGGSGLVLGCLLLVLSTIKFPMVRLFMRSSRRTDPADLCPHNSHQARVSRPCIAPLPLAPVIPADPPRYPGCGSNVCYCRRVPASDLAPSPSPAATAAPEFCREKHIHIMDGHTHCIHIRIHIHVQLDRRRHKHYLLSAFRQGIACTEKNCCPIIHISYNWNKSRI